MNIANTLHFSPNLSAFESLKNASYFDKIQGADLALLLSTYFANADKIKNREYEYNQNYEVLEKDWESNFRNNGRNVFLKLWELKMLQF